MALPAKALPEKTRNRLLRRADWRFLLPTPLPERSICFEGGLLGEAVELISSSTSRVWREADAGSYNLAVAVNPDAATVEAAFKSLQPGGTLYTEWYSPLSGGPRPLKRRLAKAGFSENSCYWPWPLPARRAAQFWLPFQAPAALDYFLKSRAKPAGAWSNAAKRAIYAAWKLGLWLGLIFPVCVVSRKPVVAGETTAPAPGLAEILAANWPAGEVEGKGEKPGPEPAEIAWVLLTGGRRSINKVVGLVFANRERQPRMVVKMPRIVEAIPALQREAVTLQAVQSLHPEGLSGIPRVLFCEKVGDSLVLGETALTGQPLFTRLRRDNFRELALQATDWLVKLASNARPEPRRAWWEQLVAPALAEFAESFGAVLGQDALQQTQALLGELDTLPVVCEHRDFSPWNVMVSSRGELEILDWEGAELNGLPFLDLVYFLTYLTFFLEGTLDSEQFGPTYRAMLESSTFTGQVFAECVERYAEQVGVARTALRPLRLLTWILHTRSEYRHFTADMARKPDAELLRHSLFFKLWEAELNLNEGASTG